ncbi:prophage tail fiber N-terminal domain-containing protein [Citrobacter meridianamericanus]|uniref:prophage tail fiber N-terminal domain-containing protein n=1 Tax=Citrobacter meridianamericanus TaxID=2894201 RepID=UPI00351D483D
MSVNISGKLLDGTGKPVPGCTIQLKAKRTSPTVIAHVISSDITGADGAYSLSAEPGYYSVALIREGFEPAYAGEIYVTPTDKPGTLNAFLNTPKDGDLRPEVMKRFEAMVNLVAAQSAQVRADVVSAAGSASAAASSKNVASISATAAGTSATNAAGSAAAAAASATAAKASETASKASETAVKTSESNAASSKAAAEISEAGAASSAASASASATSATGNKNAAAISATASATSALNAKISEDAAAASAAAAKISETNAGASATSASASATSATGSRNAAAASAVNAADSEKAAALHEQSSAAHETNAGKSAADAAQSASAARISEGVVAAAIENAGKTVISTAPLYGSGTTKDPLRVPNATTWGAGVIGIPTDEMILAMSDNKTAITPQALGKAFQQMGLLDMIGAYHPVTDMNEAISKPMYAFGVPAPRNWPAGGEMSGSGLQGLAIIVPHSNGCAQILMTRNNRLFFRFRSNDVWGGWQQAGGTGIRSHRNLYLRAAHRIFRIDLRTICERFFT